MGCHRCHILKFVVTGEPRYIDPMSGSHPSFQARIAELANLESETIRWERARKVKKKPKEKE